MEWVRVRKSRKTPTFGSRYSYCKKSALSGLAAPVRKSAGWGQASLRARAHQTLEPLNGGPLADARPASGHPGCPEACPPYKLLLSLRLFGEGGRQFALRDRRGRLLWGVEHLRPADDRLGGLVDVVQGHGVQVDAGILGMPPPRNGGNSRAMPAR